MKKYFIVCLVFLSACASKKDPRFENEVLINLVDSTRIIRSLVYENKLDAVLEKHDPEQLDLLLYNFSPAQMAFETEVLSTTACLVIIYYYNDTPQDKEFIKELTLLASQDNEVKFVVINCEILFSLAEDAGIETFPTIIVSKDRIILETITENITLPLVQQKIREYKK